MKILILGKNGQIGHELTDWLQCLDGKPMQVVALDRGQMDLDRPVQVRAVIDQLRPDVIVNAAAYTDVDLAERDDRAALRINGDAVGEIAQAARRCGAALIHYSTDYVFDGTKDSPYVETDAVNPINAYGRSKVAGEEALQASGVAYLILRTSWVYSMHGKNFLKTIQRLAAQRSDLTIVADQFGAPTWSRTVAQQTAQILAQLCRRSKGGDVTEAGIIDGAAWEQYSGVYHLTAQGHTTWHGLANAILRRARHTHEIRIRPILSENYPALARRPRNSRLSCERFKQCFGVLPAWETALAYCLEET